MSDSSAEQRAALLRREEVCDEFEQALLDASSLCWNTFWRRSRPVHRRKLFQELLRIELPYLDHGANRLTLPSTRSDFHSLRRYWRSSAKEPRLWQCSPEDAAPRKCAPCANRLGDRPEPSAYIRCPHCHEAMDVASDVPLAGVVCEVCGSQFSLAGNRHKERAQMRWYRLATSS